ncbi:MAG TPA: phosphopantetheine-binding protein [Tepidisphaeraceae bacterium]
MIPLLNAELVQEVREVVRRDLKLAANEPIDEGMAFFGGNVDLDSLDMLLLLTSIERKFGVKIPNEKVGKEAFQSLGSLVQYIQNHRAAAASAGANGSASAGETDWIARLPHGPEFRFVSRVDEVKPGEMARGVWSVTGKEPWLAGHFPGSPIVPGVLIAEALAQISGMAGPEDGGSGGKVAHIDIRFEAPAVPPVEIVINAKLTRVLGALQMFEVSAQAGPTILARGSIALHRGEKRA